ncbi:hypothetical protein QE152_g9292 [Popillia japonica]|uniref:Uncharacterized protein n=1 Tax=Popillia japonica TaxID=7064 RepID=A0AAW1LZ07_POPJA
MERLANFMGHDLAIHKQHYRLSSTTMELKDISKLLLIMEGADIEKYRGRTSTDIVCETLEEHNKILERVLERARQVNLKFNADKWNFLMPEIKYLGHTFSSNGMSPDQKKVQDLTIDKAVEVCRAKRIAKEQAQEVHNEVKKADFVKKKENKYERKQCGKCGGIHEYRRCPAFGKECNKCRRVYHFARVCRSQKGNVHRKRRGCVNMEFLIDLNESDEDSTDLEELMESVNMHQEFLIDLNESDEDSTDLEELMESV